MCLCLLGSRALSPPGTLDREDLLHFFLGSDIGRGALNALSKKAGLRDAGFILQKGLPTKEIKYFQVAEAHCTLKLQSEEIKEGRLSDKRR